MPEIISRLQGEYGSDTREFRVLDIIADALPAADLWLARDVFIHFPNRDVIKTLANFAESGVKYLLTTTYSSSTMNPDINFGEFRTINLEKPPFNLPKPILAFDDFVLPRIPHNMALWSNEQIRDWRKELNY